MSTTLHRHDISDEIWSVLEPHLPGQKGQWGRVADDNRRFINAVFWILRTGAPWRDLPPTYGNWNSVAKRFRRWVESGLYHFDTYVRRRHGNLIVFITLCGLYFRKQNLFNRFLRILISSKASAWILSVSTQRRSRFEKIVAFFMAPPVGLEPTTLGCI